MEKRLAKNKLAKASGLGRRAGRGAARDAMRDFEYWAKSEFDPYAWFEPADDDYASMKAATGLEYPEDGELPALDEAWDAWHNGARREYRRALLASIGRWLAGQRRVDPWAS